MNINSILQEAKEKLQTIDTFKSVKVGLEIGIGAKDCPFARIVAVSDEFDGMKRTLNFSVVFGFDIKNKDLEKLYQTLYSTQDKIVEKLQYNLDDGVCMYISTSMDEDRLQNLKSAIMHFRVDGIEAQLWK